MLENELGPKGYVVISDKDGNVIREGHNMVLLNGKKMIASNLFNLFNSTSESTSITDTINISSFSGYKITNIAIYSNADETIFDGSYSIDNPENSGNTVDGNTDNNTIINKIKEFEVTTSNTTIEKAENLDGHFYIKISVAYKGESQTNVPTANSIALIATANGKEKIMFSRIRFDSIVLTTETEFNISYYLYF